MGRFVQVEFDMEQECLLRRETGPIITWKAGFILFFHQKHETLVIWKNKKNGNKQVLGRVNETTEVCYVSFISITGKTWGLELVTKQLKSVFCFPSEENQVTCFTQLSNIIDHYKTFVFQQRFFAQKFSILLDEEISDVTLMKTCCDLLDRALIGKDLHQEQVSFLVPESIFALQRLIETNGEASSIILLRRELSEIQSGEREELGNGGFGRVWKGTWNPPQLPSIPVAVKEIHSELCPLNSPFDLIAFRREISVLRMMRHKNLLSYYGYAFDSPYYYVITELASCNLLDFINKFKPNVSISTKLHIVRGICQGLSELHRLQIAHRDLKSENCLLVCGEHELPIVKIGDFGIARVQQESGLTAAVGTFNYMSPEFLNSRSGQIQADQLLASDMYSLGHLIYAVMELKEPHEDRSPAEIIKFAMSGRPLKITPKNWTSGLFSLVEKCWGINPANRPTIDHFVDLMTQCDKS